MKYVRPDDYDQFRCLAGNCPNTCCAAWEIVVDPEAQDRYLRLRHPLGKKLRAVMRVDEDGDTYFAQADGACPFLCADRLCELQRTLGETALCETCRNFPRYTVWLYDRAEQGLSLACPQAARMLLARTEPLRLTEVSAPEDGYAPGARELRLTDLLTALRGQVLDRLARADHTAAENLAVVLQSAARMQQLLSRHRLCALESLTPGDAPPRIRCAPCAPATPANFTRVFRTLEALDDRWPPLLAQMEALPAFPSETPLPALQQTLLAQQIVLRYWMDALGDRDTLFAVRYAAVSLLTLRCLTAVSADTPETLLVLYTREMENSPVNLARLHKALCTDPAFSAGSLCAALVSNHQEESLCI